jgi:hypothetical protein
MRIGPASAVGAAIAAAMGGSYAASGSPDFSVEVHRSPAAVYAAFAEINPSDTDLQAAGFTVPHVSVSRVSAHELVFTSPTANENQPIRIAFSFAPGSNSATTKVTAAIDVPPIPLSIDGTDKYLSEDKVEAKIRDAIGELAKQIDNGNSTRSASYKLATILEMVALASHPKQLKAAMERSEAEAAEHQEFRSRYESEGWRFNDDGTAEQSADDAERAARGEFRRDEAGDDGSEAQDSEGARPDEYRD